MIGVFLISPKEKQGKWNSKGETTIKGITFNFISKFPSQGCHTKEAAEPEGSHNPRIPYLYLSQQNPSTQVLHTSTLVTNSYQSEFIRMIALNLANLWKEMNLEIQHPLSCQL